ncbi:MAG TPA: recombinase family protein [Candidatus Dormibacteraeota bacterium]|nr:recombinase family protein [Candidatus Dormibacteraeota bacterium]
MTTPGRDEARVDKAIRKRTRRPALAPALVIARAGDRLMVTKLDCLGHSLEQLIALSNDLQVKGVDTSTAVGRMFF